MTSTRSRYRCPGSREPLARERGRRPPPLSPASLAMTLKMLLGYTCECNFLVMHDGEHLALRGRGSGKISWSELGDSDAEASGLGAAERLLFFHRILRVSDRSRGQVRPDLR